MLHSIQSVNLSFPLLFYVIYSVILKFPSWFSALSPLFSTFFTFPPRLHAPAFPSHSSHSHSYSSHFLHFVPEFSILAFTDSLLNLQFLRIYFNKIVALVQKRTLSFVTTVTAVTFVITMSPPKSIYLTVSQKKKNL